VLEQLWLKDRQGPNGAFYKGLIQLAGAFVHLRKERLRPATALFKLAEANLGKYPAVHEQLHLPAILAVIQHWLAHLERSKFSANPLHTETHPVLRLMSGS
jgi:predicted metal-dependent hydrolase